MSDVNNPGQVSVEGEVYGNPNPNGGTVTLTPEELAALTQAANQGYPPAVNGVDSTTFPTPVEVTISQVPTGQRVLAYYEPNATEVNVDEQVLGQGVWVLVDPLNPALGKRFVPPGEFLVVDSQTTIQTNESVATTVLCTITGVFDAGNLWNAPTVDTLRLLLTVSAPALTSYLVSVLGREITFSEDTLTPDIGGAVRTITGFGRNFLAINVNNPNDSEVPSLITLPGPVMPAVGDTFWLNVQREGAQAVSQDVTTPIEVVILPQPPAFVPNAGQSLVNDGTFEIALGRQPNLPIITSGTQVPTAITVQVADQSSVNGLPKNVFI
jgi:hypothetical protein